MSILHPVILVVSPSGRETAERIKRHIPQAAIHVRAGRGIEGDNAFTDTITELAALFEARHPIIAICAAGIVIRALGGLVGDKRTEPPVLAVDPKGQHFVPLLGGHHGANRMATELANAFEAQAAVTTAGDALLGLAVDEPPIGYILEDDAAAKSFTVSALAGTPVEVFAEDARAQWLKGGKWLTGAGGLTIRVSAAATPDPADLVYRPAVAVLGLGCARGCAEDELMTLAAQVLAEGGVSPKALACVASVDVKADEAAVHAVAEHFGVPARFFPAHRLEEETPRLETPSEVVFAEVGCHGVSEGAALASVGVEGRLAVAKRKTANATAALAVSPEVIDPMKIGHPQGVLHIVGIGPGTEAWRSPDATRRLAEADEWVGYKLYLDLLGDLSAGKILHHSDLGAEEARARRALELAAEGKNVALIGSGDAGIYALATLVFEVLDRDDQAALNRVRVEVAPGISALQAAAARSGAPLGHDFCAISLSDLLTPRDAIIRRVTAAAQGDFVIAFYNPVSKRRRTLLAEARDILLQHRPADCPVIIARNLGRDEEEVAFVPLSELSVDDVDMLTTVMVGSSTSKLIARGEQAWVYTPRGYAKKGAEAASAPVETIK